MYPCSTLVGRLSCPCDRFQDGAKANVCDNCLHSFSDHLPPTTTKPTDEPGSRQTSLAPSRARSVTALFQSLIKSTPGGSLAIQETSAAFRKSGTSASAVGSPVFYSTVSDFRSRAPPISEVSWFETGTYKRRAQMPPFDSARLSLFRVALRLINQ